MTILLPVATVHASRSIRFKIYLHANTNSEKYKKTITAAVTAEYTQLLSTIVNEHKFRAAKKSKIPRFRNVTTAININLTWCIAIEIIEPENLIFNFLPR